jgi:hypothetical protein
MTYELHLITKNALSRITFVPPGTSLNYPFVPIFKVYKDMLHSFSDLAIVDEIYLLKYLHMYLKSFV